MSEIETVIKKYLHQVAPEADLDAVQPDDDLGKTLDIDSMDFYRMMVAISEELDVEIPEKEYGELRSLEKIVEFLKAKMQ